jgi:eukaryotic-like serine/threonine-protein kinase
VIARTDVRVRLDGIPPHAWVVASLLVLCLIYSVVEVGFVRSRMPAGHPAAWLPGVLLARPPALDPGTDETAAIQLSAWRTAYWQTDLLATSAADVPEHFTTRGRDPRERGAHTGRVLQVIAFVGAAVVLFVLRSSDLTAALSVLALALSGVAAGGPLYGFEDALPGGRVMTVFTWLAGPLAFPIIALAILYFPAPSPRLSRFPALHVVPFVAAAPMIGTALMTSLYLSGVGSALEAALWDARHPGIFHASVAAALTINVLAVAEGIHRYRFNHDANERRRIRMAVYTCVPGILAYALKDGVPIVSHLLGGAPRYWPPTVAGTLQAMLLLPAFGLVYAVGVARVLGPRMVLRRSLQYTLATRTLTLLAVLPAAALIVSLVRNPETRIRDVLTSVYAGLLAMSIAALVYRERARQWLDQRFFREEYDARKILLSLVSRVRFETDPSDLAALVVQQIDEALHPERVAILARGLDDTCLTAVTALGEAVDPLPLDGGLVAMLRWSDDPLEILLADPRSPLRRLPPEERAWVERSRAALLVPVHGDDRSLLGVVVLGERRSEEAYTAEDRALLASIAAQMALGFDVARLRRRLEGATVGSTDRDLTTRVVAPSAHAMAECPRCGRCEDAGVLVCPADGSPMALAGLVPRVLDHKYRLEHLLGRGGMGAVYRARDMRLDRLVAVKVVRADLIGNPDARRRFRREAQIIARLQHPAIVAVFDYGTLDDGSAYLVMEFVRGEDLRRVLVRESRLDPARAVRILSTVCGAIEAAHREGVLHRDLKPENIVLPAGDLDAKVLDFGIAKVTAADHTGAAVASPDAATVLTVEGAVVGTPAYMAPEQLRGQAPDARADVFSLGVIAYEVLAGDLPFGRGTLADIVLAQARGLPRDGVHTLPPALARAIRAALEIDPDRRLPSPQAFAHLLGAAEGL